MKARVPIKMKKKLSSTERCSVALLGLIILLFSATSFADNVLSLLDPGENEASDENREYLIDREGGTVGQIDVGDSIRGFFNINTVNSAGGNVGGNTGNNEWSGVYQLLITDKQSFGNGLFLFTAAPDPAFEADLSGGVGTADGFVPGAGAVMVFFEDDTPDAAGDFDDVSPSTPPPPPDDGTTAPAGTTPPSSEDVSIGPYESEEAFGDTTTDGAHFWTLGFNGSPGEGLQLFTQFGRGDNVLYGFNNPSATTFAVLSAGLSRLTSSNPGVGDDVVVAPISLGPFGERVEFVVNGNLKGVANLDTPFELSSDLTITWSVLPSIGDRLWEDLNGNGVQDCDDTNGNGIIGDVGDIGPECNAGIENATVNLLDPGPDGDCGTGDETQLESTSTDDRGFYGFLFLNSLPTEYCVEFVRPTGLCSGGGDAVFTTPNQGGDPAKDSNADPVTGQTPNIGLADNDTTDLTWDAGVYCLASLGDRFWDDTDNPDGIQGNPADEPGLEGVTVNLYQCDANGNPGASPVRTATTGADGLYDFGDLPPGLYDIEFEIPQDLLDAGYVFTLRNQGGDPALDSDADPATGRTGCIIELTSDEDDTTWDGGAFAPNAGLGDRLWHDLNYNGLQDTGEPGVDNVQVTLLSNPDGDAACTSGDEVPQGVATTVGGQYLFEDLFAGNYCVQFALPDPFCDFGDVQFTLQNVGGDDSIDSDVDPATGRTGNITLANNDTDLTWDAGVFCPAVLGDRFWDDSDNPDGIQGDPADEPGIEGVTVSLYVCDAVNGTPSGTPVASTLTDVDGIYSFVVDPGVYDIEFVIPPALVASGYSFTLPNQGSDPALDSDVDPATGRTGCVIEMDSNEDDPTWDGGAFVTPAGLGDRLWDDLNFNGIQDGGEPGIPGVTVRLLENPDGDASCTSGDESEIDSQTTVAGNYLFEDLLTGNYCVQFDTPDGYCPFGDAQFTLQNVGGDDTVDSDVDPATGRTGNIFLPSGATDLSWDAGVVCPARLGDRVWDDFNGDGIQNCLDSNMDGILGNAGDVGPECLPAGIADVTVRLLSPGADGLCNTGDETQLDATTTDPGGFYLFDDLLPGSYCVEVDRPVGFPNCTIANQGADNAADSDVQEPGTNPPVSCQSDDPAENPIELQSGEEDRTWDAGLLDSEVCDTDNNGVIDENDIRDIIGSRGQPADGPDDPRDADGDGIISTRDAKLCIPQCTNTNCAP